MLKTCRGARPLVNWASSSDVWAGRAAEIDPDPRRVVRRNSVAHQSLGPVCPQIGSEPWPDVPPRGNLSDTSTPSGGDPVRRLVIATALVGVCAPLLAACSDDSTAATPTTSSPPPSVTTPPSAPPPQTTSTPPEPDPLPPLAKQESIAGAKAFVRFYFGAINQSWDTGSGAILRHYSTPRCIACRGMASSMESIHANNGFYRGGDWIVTYTTPIPLQQSKQPIINTAVIVRPGTWKRSPSDHLRLIPADKIHIDVHLAWSGKNWLVTSLVLA